MLAARDRAAGAAARAALLRDRDGTAGPAPGLAAPVEVPLAEREPTAPTVADSADLPVPQRGSEAGGPVDKDTMARLREAKRRARGR
jgi:hypothetical protein